jgi:hypothetical protein
VHSNPGPTKLDSLAVAAMIWQNLRNGWAQKQILHCCRSLNEQQLPLEVGLGWHAVSGPNMREALCCRFEHENDTLAQAGLQSDSLLWSWQASQGMACVQQQEALQTACEAATIRGMRQDLGIKRITKEPSCTCQRTLLCCLLSLFAGPVHSLGQQCIW